MKFVTYLANPEVREAALAVLCSLISAICGVIAQYHRGKRRNTERKLELALSDIAFLYAVVERYGEFLALHDLPKSKNAMYAQARDDGFVWSERFTPGRMASRAGRRGNLGIEIRRMIALYKAGAASNGDAA
ncbi:MULTISPECIES: hypothetical protein [unclassified Paraburkholderia]|uniref:hypothetical protein n=1 Tax=unclassified Paraburkholderia TaxID=2615204 RepID=UPI002AAFAB1E|nr:MULTISPECIES: hypothetical protein [unclassified Paraburkholderia]